MVRFSVQARGELLLQVSDDGPGIAVEDRAKMFERFRRGAEVTATGSGLGLAIVASAACQLGSGVEVSEGLGGRGVGFGLRWRPLSISKADLF